MTSDEYEKLPVAEQEHFFQCPDCGEMFDFRSLEDLVFHLVHQNRSDQHPAFGTRKDFNSRSES